MLKLQDTTLVIVDCVNVQRGLVTVKDTLSKCLFDDVKFLTSLNNNLTFSVKIPTINNIEEYSKFVIFDLHKYIYTKYMLIIQHDSSIGDTSKWNDDWYNYDYIGGWAGGWKWRKVKIGGNGGFSFRTKKLMTKVSEICDWNNCEYRLYEDLAICSTLSTKLIDNGFKFYPKKLGGETFSQNRKIYAGKQFGWHQVKNKKELLINNNI